jgi:hypothetical protein
VKLYLVSTYSKLLKNTGGIEGSFDSYDEAFEAARVGQFIHAIDAQEVHEIRNAGKVSVRVDGSTK